MSAAEAAPLAMFAARREVFYGEADAPSWWGKLRPSIHMPFEASRLALEITSLRVERLQDITEQDAEREGVTLPETWECGKDPTYRHHFARLWDEINAGRGYPWCANPWVWVIGYRVLDGTPAEVAARG